MPYQEGETSASKPVVSTNIEAFEVILKGSEIELTSTVSVDERALADGVRFASGRARLQISSSGRRTVVTVDDSYPVGHNTLFVSDLYTPQGHRIQADMEVPFFVLDSSATVPKDVRIHSYTRVIVESDRIRRATKEDTQAFELLKGIRRKDQGRWEAAYDSAGKAVDFSLIHREVLRARWERYGKLHPRLSEALDQGAREPISVAVWLRADPGSRLVKSSRGETHEVDRREANARARYELIARRFAESNRLHELDPYLRIDLAAPLLFIRLPEVEIRRLANSDEVSAIFLYEREGIDDLADSISIARSDEAHVLGYTGKGVNVAVYEAGPDDTTNLLIDASFRSDPETTDHARLTHGIIKNREHDRPHGHAPNCNLHSANDRDLSAIRWAAQDRGCTVINQGFHSGSEETSDELSFDDIYKDWLALHWPYPTICEAAGNGDDTEYVNHKGYNRLTVGNHNDTASGMASLTVFRNPSSVHGDRELPEIAANGIGVEAVGVMKSGTSFSAPAVAGATACIQEVSSTLRSWPEGCRAILLASAGLNPSRSYWWEDVLSGVDGEDGSGALDTWTAVRVAEQRKRRNNAAAPIGWDVGTLRSRDVGRSDETVFSYNVVVPARRALTRTTVKVALAWDAEVTESDAFGVPQPLSSVLTVDLDLTVYDSSGRLVGYSGSWDNSYEIAEFRGAPAETYTIKIRRWSGTADVWYGIAWSTTSTPLFADLSSMNARLARHRTSRQ